MVMKPTIWCDKSEKSSNYVSYIDDVVLICACQDFVQEENNLQNLVESNWIYLIEFIALIGRVWITW